MEIEPSIEAFFASEDSLTKSITQLVESACQNGKDCLCLPPSPELLKFPSRELQELHSTDCRVDEERVDMYRINTEAFYEPVFDCDSLHGLDAEWWVFDDSRKNIAPPVKSAVFKNNLDEDSLSSVSDLPPLGEAHGDGNMSPQKYDKRVGCRCGMSKCLRLHCRCFRDLEYCAKHCKCTDCLNNLENEETRSFVIKKTKEINKNAFKAKMIYFEHQDKSKINSEGCTCKTGCNRNYCECFKNKTGCSSICKCLDCKNVALSVPEGHVRKLFKPVSRKKNKIIIQELKISDDPSSSQSSNFPQMSRIESLLTNDGTFPELSESDNMQIKHVELAGRCLIAIKQYKKIKDKSLC